jgi:hypothetical protein
VKSIGARAATFGSGIAFASAATPSEGDHTMMGGFAIVPDNTEQPRALFTDLEDAIDWGMCTFGANSFRIRWIEMVLLPPREVRRPAGIA